MHEGRIPRARELARRYVRALSSALLGAALRGAWLVVLGLLAYVGTSVSGSAVRSGPLVSVEPRDATASSPGPLRKVAVDAGSPARAVLEAEGARPLAE